MKSIAFNGLLFFPRLLINNIKCLFPFSAFNFLFLSFFDTFEYECSYARSILFYFFVLFCVGPTLGLIGIQLDLMSGTQKEAGVLFYLHNNIIQYEGMSLILIQKLLGQVVFSAHKCVPTGNRLIKYNIVGWVGLMIACTAKCDLWLI